jgi:dUTP pyrophosphatase
MEYVSNIDILKIGQSSMNTFYIKLVDENKLVSSYSKGITNYTTDCGYDLYCPDELTIPAKAVSFKIDLKIQTKMEDRDHNNVGYKLYPRSSMGAKTPLRLCNSIGVIDPGYRGNLMMFVDNVSDTDYTVQIGDRLGQAVCFTGVPIISRVVDQLDTTDRGDHGFGSTGR